MLGQLWHRTCGSSQPTYDLTYGPLHKKESIPGTAWVTMNLRLDSLAWHSVAMWSCKGRENQALCSDGKYQQNQWWPKLTKAVAWDGTLCRRTWLCGCASIQFWYPAIGCVASTLEETLKTKPYWSKKEVSPSRCLPPKKAPNHILLYQYLIQPLSEKLHLLVD